jgi:hypothetical protein
MTDSPPHTSPRHLGQPTQPVPRGSRLLGSRNGTPPIDLAAAPDPITATPPGRQQATTGAQDAAQRGWAGPGFTRPGPGAEVPRDLYRAALQDALAYTTDRDGCGDCDRDQLCDIHTVRAARACQYQDALDEELEAAP